MPNLISDPQSHLFSDSLMSMILRDHKMNRFLFFFCLLSKDVCFHIQALEKQPIVMSQRGPMLVTTTLMDRPPFCQSRQNSETSVRSFRGENRNMQCFQLASDLDWMHWIV